MNETKKTGNLATGPLLAGGFIGMLALIGVAVFGAVSMNNTLADLTNKIYRHPLAVSNAVRDASADIIAMHRDMKDVALARNSGELETAITSVAGHEARVYKSFDVIMDRFLGDKSLIEQAHKTFTDWRPIRSEVIDLTRKGLYGEAAMITKGKGARHVVLMSSRMDGLIDFASSKASQFLADSKRQQERSQAFLYGTLFVVVMAGAVIAYFVVSRTRHAEARILEAKNEAERANNAKSEFLSSMSHDLRTPLNAVIGFSDMMANETYGPMGNPKYREYTRDIHSSGLHLVHMINDILDLSKIEAGHYELENDRLNLADSFSATMRMIEPLARAKELKTAIDVPDRMPDLWGDRRAVTQIITNLLANAVKFTERGGAIIAQAYRGPDGTLSMAVSDNGVGMGEEDMAKVVEPFYRGNSQIAHDSEGTGLGLYLCQKLAGIHDATMSIESGSGGTTVTVTFPRERNMELRLVG